jgi:hypothetical protein
MSTTPKPTEESRAKAAIDLAKTFVPSAIAAQGPLPKDAQAAEVAAYFDRTCNIAFSLAGLFRRKSLEVLSSAQAMDAKESSDAN